MDRVKLLEGDLRLLSSEAKGFAAVKDSAERGIMKLRAVQDGFAGDGRQRCPEFIRPFLLACNHTEAGKRVLSVAIAAMQRLIMMDVVDAAEPPNILRVLLLQVRGFRRRLGDLIAWNLGFLAPASPFLLPRLCM